MRWRPKILPGMKQMFLRDMAPSPGCVPIACQLLHGDKCRMVALEAASDFRRVPGSDSWTREMVLFWGLLRRMGCALIALVTAKAVLLKPFWLTSKLDQASDGMTF